MDKPGEPGPVGRSCIVMENPCLPRGEARLSAKYWTYIVPLMQSPQKIRSSSLCLKPRLGLNNPNHSLVCLLETEYWIWYSVYLSQCWQFADCVLSTEFSWAPECLGTMELRPWVEGSSRCQLLYSRATFFTKNCQIPCSVLLPTCKTSACSGTQGRQNSNLPAGCLTGLSGEILKPLDQRKLF